MSATAQLLLVGGVVAVGVLHTIVPDHWLPIVLLARQRGWSRSQTAGAAVRAGSGHVVSTLLIGVAVWFGGAVLAENFATWIDLASSIALVAFGGWIALAALRELRRDGSLSLPHHHHHHAERSHGRAHDHRATADFEPALAAAGAGAQGTRHIHVHRHGDGFPHLHWHDHPAPAAHQVLPEFETNPPWHEHAHRTGGSTALLLILGSSPMVEGIPVFFAAAKYGALLIAVMAVAFAASTIATYVVLCAYSTAGLRRLRLGRIERYGEVLSGALIAAIGLVFGFASLA